MILHLLDGLNHIHVVQCKRTRALHERYVGQACELTRYVVQPIAHGFSSDNTLGRRQQPATGLVLLIDEEHAQSSATGDQGREQSRCAAANHQNLGMMVLMIVGLGIGFDGRAAISGRVANDVLELRPQGTRLKCLVVEARRHKAREVAANTF